jgi:hypothetical protein
MDADLNERAVVGAGTEAAQCQIRHTFISAEIQKANRK